MLDVDAVKPLPIHLRQVLIYETISRQNKLWLATSWAQCRGWFVEWKWAGAEMRSRLCFRFTPEGSWFEAKSFDEDVRPHLKFAKEMKR
jgi:hypothetical protein